MVHKIQGDQLLQDKLKADPVATLKEVAQEATTATNPAYYTDPLIYRIVVIFLGVVIVMAVGGAIWIALADKTATVPDIVTALGAASVGALAGLFAPSPAQAAGGK